MNNLFSACSNLEKIDDISEWKTKNLVNMGEMFNFLNHFIYYICIL